MAKRLLLLLLAGLAALPVAGAAEPDYPRARPLTDRTFEPGPARIERGRYLTEHLLQCFVCHSERDWDAPGAPPIAGRKGAGVVMSERADRRIVAPNITPDPRDRCRPLDRRHARPRHSRRHRARWPGPVLGHVVPVLRRPVRRGPGRGRRVPAHLAAGAQCAAADRAARPKSRQPTPGVHKPITAPVAGPAPGDTKALGRYLIGVADCTGCHSAWEAPRNPGSARRGQRNRSRHAHAHSAAISRGTNPASRIRRRLSLP